MALKTQIRAATDPRDKERLQVVQWATSGQHTLADLARLAGRARSIIQVWLGDFAAGGLARLLERETPPRQAQPARGGRGASPVARRTPGGPVAHGGASGRVA